MTKTLANKYLGLAIKRDVSHPEKGYNLSITRTGTTMTTTEYSDIDRDDEKTAAPEKFLNALQSFREVLRQYDEAKQKQKYYGHEQEEDEEEEETTRKSSGDDEEEDEPKPGKNVKKPVKDEDEGEKESSGDV